MKNVMVRAWEIAKGAVVKFGGKVKEYFAQALAMAWAEVKAPAVKKNIQEVAALLRSRVHGATVSVCEKGGKHRIYVNKSFKQGIAVLEFDADSNFLGKTELSGMELFGLRQNGVEDQAVKVYEVMKSIA